MFRVDIGEQGQNYDALGNLFNQNLGFLFKLDWF